MISSIPSITALWKSLSAFISQFCAVTIKVADFSNVSIDYLLDRSSEKTISSSFISGADLNDVLDGVMSWNGEKLTEADKEAVRKFLAGRKSK